MGYIDPTDWMDYSVNIASAGTYTISLRIATPANNGQLQIRKADGTTLATINLPNTGGFQMWQTVKASLNLTQGMQTLRIVSTSPPWNNWNINWFELNFGALSGIAVKEKLEIQPNGIIGLYPNPVHQSTTLEVNNEDAGEMKILIYSINGAVVKQINQVKPMVGRYSLHLPLNELKAGSYILRVKIAKWMATTRFLKLE
ncbi:MAG: hypothetical protein NVS1B13_08060 [Flavisolibacter sp.]